MFEDKKITFMFFKDRLFLHVAQLPTETLFRFNPRYSKQLLKIIVAIHTFTLKVRADKILTPLKHQRFLLFFFFLLTTANSRFCPFVLV